MKIRTKQEFHRLWSAGCLGNRLRVWETIEQALCSPVENFALREIGKAGGGMWLPVKRYFLPELANQWRGVTFRVEELAPDQDVQLQGEVCQTIRGWEGTLGIRTGRSMRGAFAAGMLVPRHGLIVRHLLKTFLDASSVETIDDLLEMYPDATIEFASYPFDVGIIPGRNTIIWEVRDY